MFHRCSVAATSSRPFRLFALPGGYYRLRRMRTSLRPRPIRPAPGVARTAMVYPQPRGLAGVALGGRLPESQSPLPGVSEGRRRDDPRQGGGEQADPRTSPGPVRAESSQPRRRVPEPAVVSARWPLAAPCPIACAWAGVNGGGAAVAFPMTAAATSRASATSATSLCLITAPLSLDRLPG